MKALIIFFLVLGTAFTPGAFAQPPMLEAEQMLLSTSSLRAKLKAELEKDEFVAKLKAVGVSKGEVQMRLAAMTDQELAQVQQGVSRQVGGDVVVISVGTLLLIIIIILLLRP